MGSVYSKEDKEDLDLRKTPEQFVNEIAQQEVDVDSEQDGYFMLKNKEVTRNTEKII